jgi:putative nucleotidyltransferase with HDIG domain
MMLMGATLAGRYWQGWSPVDASKFSAYLVVGGVAAWLQLRLVSGQDRVPVGFLFSLLGLAEFPLADAVLLGCCLGAIELAGDAPWTSRRLLGSASVAIVSVAVAGEARQEIPIAHPVWGEVARQAAAAVSMWLVQVVSMTVLETNAPPYPRSAVVLWRRHMPALPYFALAAVMAMAVRGSNGVFGWDRTLLLLPAVYLAVRAWTLKRETLTAKQLYTEEMETLHLRTIEALAMAIDAKDGTTAEHLRRVQVYALETGERLGLGTDEMKALHVASLLHDIGKIGVPESIISKPGKLTPDEFAKMRLHPALGAEIIERVGFPYPVAPMVRSHHEKWDGTGYPDGLKGEAIPIGARILAAVDALDALASDRQYRRALPLDEAMRRIQGASGTAFDPRVVDVLAKNYEEFERKARQRERMLGPLPGSLPVPGALPVPGSSPVPAAGFEQPSLGSGSRSDTEVLLRVRGGLESILEGGSRLQQILGHRELLRVVGATLQEQVRFDAMVHFERRGDRWEASFAMGWASGHFDRAAAEPGTGLAGWVAEHRKPILNGNPAVEAGYTGGEMLGAALAVPVQEGPEVVGVLALYRRERDSFSKLELQVAELVARRLSGPLGTALGERRSEPSKQALTLEARVTEWSEDAFELLLLKVWGGGVPEPSPEAVMSCLGSTLDEGIELYHVLGREFVALRKTRGLASEVERYRERLRRTLPGAWLEAGEAACPEDGNSLLDLLLAADQRMTGRRRMRRTLGQWDANEWLAENLG